jgi:hypothetical protein
MCAPIDTLTATTAAQAAATMWGNRQVARTNTNQYGLIVEAAGQNYEAVAQRGRQVRGQIKEKLGERAEQSAKELGRINAVLADSNLKGASSDRLRQEVLFNESRDVAALQENAFQASEQTRRDMRAITTDTRARIGEVGARAPSVIGSGLSLLSAGMTNKGPTLRDLWDTSKPFFSRGTVNSPGVYDG